MKNELSHAKMRLHRYFVWIYGYVEALKQLSKIIISDRSLFSEPVQAGYMRGIDFYSSFHLIKCLAKSFRKFKLCHGKYPNIVNPEGFNEKIVWFKFFGKIKIPESGNKLLTSYFIPESLAKSLTCPNILWHSKEPILPTNLTPGIYYLKSNHGSGMFKIIRYPLSSDQKSELENLCSSWHSNSYGLSGGQWWYSAFEKELLIEESVAENTVSDSWCFYVFGSEIPLVSVATKTVDAIDTIWLDGEGTPLSTQRNNRSTKGFILPDNFPTMKKYALEIGKYHNFVRVDFIIGLNGNFFLGEITLSPSNGLAKRPLEVDMMLGRLWIHQQ